MSNVCPNCHSAVEPNAKFCMECGTQIQPLKGVPTTTSQQQPVIPNQQSQATVSAPISQQSMASYDPNKFYRSWNDRKWLGVCGGLAKHLNMDSDLVRFLTVVLFLMTGGSVLIAYIVAALIFPYDPREYPPQPMPTV